MSHESSMFEETLEETLIARGLVKPKDIEDAKRRSRHRGLSWKRLLVSESLLDEERLAQCTGQCLGLRWIDASQRVVSSLLAGLQRATLSQYAFIPVEGSQGLVTIAMADPEDLLALDELRRHFGDDRLCLVVSTFSEIEAAIERAFSPPVEPAQTVVKWRSAGVVVWRETEQGVLWLLVQERIGAWGFPKGLVGYGEAPREAALRECREESGIHLHLEDLHADFEETCHWTMSRGPNLIDRSVVYFLARTTHAQTHHDHEISEVKWCPLQEALDLLHYEDKRRVLTRASAAISSNAHGV